MIKVMCETTDTIKLSELTPFQGDLKTRTKKDLQELTKSLKEEGLLMPFAVWQQEDTNYLLDGHRRLEVLIDMALIDETILEQDFPVLFIKADTEEQARKSLLQITSSYGRVTREGVTKFCAIIPNYKAPSINRFMKPVGKKLKEPSMEQIIRIAVPNDKATAVRELFKSVGYIRVL